MKQKELIAADGGHSDNFDNESKTIKLLSEKRLCEQLGEQIMSIPEEIRYKFKYCIATQGAGVKVLPSGEIEVTPPKGQFLMDPVRPK